MPDDVLAPEQITDSWHSYPQVYALGHRYVADILKDPVLVEEKIDGSQFSFGVIDGELRCRSKGKEQDVDAPDKMFEPATATAKKLDLHPGWTYRTEFVSKPKHNVLCYGRTPKNLLILFDINTGQECYMSYEEMSEEANRIGLESVPILYTGVVTDIETFKTLLDTQSCLGGNTVEGVVIKNYARFGLDKKCLMGKYVSEKFKETHAKEWKAMYPGQGDVLTQLVTTYKTEARWQKAVQHLRDAGTLTDSPKDIGALIKEVQQDILKECKDEIGARLFKWAWDQRLSRSVIAGLPEWYKETLLKSQFMEHGE